MSADHFPLDWPSGWPRHEGERLSDGRFRGHVYGLAMARSRNQLVAELRLLGAKNAVVSSNVQIGRNGLPYVQQRQPSDPGVAVYFTFRGQSMVMACDRFNSVPGNIRSLTLAIGAMRQLERHGGGTIMGRAFTGFVAIPKPGRKKSWREVFGVQADWRGDIRSVFRQKAKERHPDSGGSNELMAELNVAFEEARRECG